MFVGPIRCNIFDFEVLEIKKINFLEFIRTKELKLCHKLKFSNSYYLQPDGLNL